MKKVFISVLLAIFLVPCFGQVKSKPSVELEIGVGGLYSFDKLFFDSVSPGVMPYGELRYNFHFAPVSIGVNASAQFFRRSVDDEKMDFNSKNVLLVADYSFPLGGKELFAGIGAGMGFYDQRDDLQRGRNGQFFYVDEVSGPFCIMPRIGMRLGRHARLTMAYLFEDKANRNLNLRLGYIF